MSLENLVSIFFKIFKDLLKTVKILPVGKHVPRELGIKLDNTDGEIGVVDVQVVGYTPHHHLGGYFHYFRNIRDIFNT